MNKANLQKVSTTLFYVKSMELNNYRDGKWTSGWQELKIEIEWKERTMMRSYKSLVMVDSTVQCLDWKSITQG